MVFSLQHLLKSNPLSLLPYNSPLFHNHTIWKSSARTVASYFTQKPLQLCFCPQHLVKLFSPRSQMTPWIPNPMDHCLFLIYVTSHFVVPWNSLVPWLLWYHCTLLAFFQPVWTSLASLSFWPWRKELPLQTKKSIQLWSTIPVP